MNSSIKLHLPLVVILLLFICLKIPYLNNAYYWDESWPYAVAIKDMYRHGVSLMPNAIDAELSRGHPLFFHAAAASWMYIFGDSHIAMHSFALLISVLFLIAVYETGLYLFNLRVAVLALVLVLAQEMFFVQSSMVLFEMLVAFLCFLSIVLYVKEKYLLCGLCLVMLFYTKESGLIAGFVLGIDALVSFFNKKLSWKIRLSRILTVALPCMLICIHFVVQKQVRGWYIFPMYAELAQHDWKNTWYSIRINSIRSQFYEYYRFYYFLLLVLVAVIAAVKNKQPRYLAIILPAICIYYFVDDMRAGRLLPSVPFFIVFIGSVLYFFYKYAQLFSERRQQKLIRLLGVFILCFLIFSGMNFFTPRYLLAALVPMFFITAAFFDAFFKRTWNWLIYPVAGIILAIGTISYANNDNYGDCDHLSINAIEVQQGIVDYFENNVPYDKQIASGLFLEREHLTDPATGFLRSSKTFSNVKYEINDQTDYFVFDNIEADPRYSDFNKNPAFELAKRIQRGRVWGEIYKRKGN